MTKGKIHVVTAESEPAQLADRATGRTPDSAAFHKLLRWLDEGHESNGARYLEMRRRLVSYFARKRCAAADDLADETLTRVTRRLDEEGSALDDATPARYCYIVAKFVFLEHLRKVKHDAPLVGDHPAPASKSGDHEGEAQLRCLDRCMATLAPRDRELILGYYQGERRLKIEHRKALAAQFGLTANALSIRTCRIRARLEACVSGCACGDERFMGPLSHRE